MKHHDLFALKKHFTQRFIRVYLPIFFTLMLTASAYAAPEPFFYTIHAGTYPLDALIPAGDRFNLLYRKLPNDTRDHLRIEMDTEGFSVRIGRFSSEEKARLANQSVRKLVHQASVIRQSKKDFGESTMLIIHKEEKAPLADPPVKEEAAGSLVAPPAKSTQVSEEEAAAALLDDISVHFFSSEYETAAELIKKGLKKWPKRAELYAWYGATLLDTGQHDKAYEQYQKAAELVPDAPEYHSGSGYSLLNIYVDRAKRSITSFEKALEIDPDNVGALEGLGIVYVSIGKKHLANAIYNRLNELDRDAALRLGEYIRRGIEWER